MVLNKNTKNIYKIKNPMSEKSSLDSFVVLHTISKGEHAVVKLIEDSYGKKFAAKIFKAKSLALRALHMSLWESELKAYRNINTLWTLRVLASSSTGIYKKKSQKGEYSCFYMLFEYCPYGSLWDVVKLSPDEKILRFYFKQIIEGVEGLHSHGLTHLNFKLENVLIDENFGLRICGFSHSSFDTQEAPTYNGRLDYYKSPEIVKRKPYMKNKADLFAIGVMFFILLLQKPPFMRADLIDPYFKMMKAKNNEYWIRMKPKNLAVSSEYQKIINSMLGELENERLSIEEIKKHAWYNLEDPTREELREFFQKVREKAKIL
ncbi:unnamed protein product [Blepharisma stoltei]|uniref:Protein kinase domain-containing protein n=1 Tax=Blepharisma stoltei TaxID=1481888 RepID=A0AAU9IJG7_9CILI|nr:unnamed protein product [Blepharisma stoltei]